MNAAAKPRRRSPIDVFRYLDYRAFLADFYKAKKRRGFSYRAFSRAAGLGAPNYLKLVIAGKRNLTPRDGRSASRRPAGCTGEAAEYFAQLVEFNQARKARQQRNARVRAADGLRALPARPQARGGARRVPLDLVPARDPRARGERRASARTRVDRRAAAGPRSSRAEAKQALDTLLELGLLERDSARTPAPGAMRSCRPGRETQRHAHRATTTPR